VSPREQAVLDALRKDRDESGPGLSKATVEEIGETRFADGLIVRLLRQRYPIGIVGDLYQLGEEPDVERASDTVASPTAADEGPHPSLARWMPRNPPCSLRAPRTIWRPHSAR
jgi:hypothetical protein